MKYQALFGLNILIHFLFGLINQQQTFKLLSFAIFVAILGLPVL